MNGNLEEQHCTEAWAYISLHCVLLIEGVVKEERKIDR
jgi:hypothetical protein